MVPAVSLSMLLGIGTNTLFMAIALPLGQSVLSFVMDTFWEKTNKPRAHPWPRSKSKKKHFTKSASNFTTREERQYEQDRTSRSSNNSTVKNGNTNTSSKYGGWDELENQNVGHRKQTQSPIQNMDGHEKGMTEKGKLSRRGRNRETPMLVRLLIAVFPFLGSWTKLML